MHEAEPLLYWRVKRNGKWKFERARYVVRNIGFNEYIVEPPEVSESE